MDNKKSLVKDMIIGIIIASLVWFIGLEILSPLILIIPAVGIIIGVKHGEIYSIIMNIVSSLILLFFFGISALFMGVIFCGVSYISSKSIRDKKIASHRIVRSIAFTFIFIILVMGVFKVGFNIDLIEEANNKNTVIFEEAINEAKKVYSGKEISQLESYKTLVGTIIEANFPVIILSFSFIISVISNYIATSFLRKKTSMIIAPIKISRFRVSIKFSLAALIAFVISFIIKGINPGIYEILISNMTVALYLILFIQGLGVISFWIEKKGISSVARIAFLVFCVISVFLSAVASFIGAFDLVFNFRKLRES